jgi:hypothetical protein
MTLTEVNGDGYFLSEWQAPLHVMFVRVYRLLSPPTRQHPVFDWFFSPRSWSIVMQIDVSSIAPHIVHNFRDDIFDRRIVQWEP